MRKASVILSAAWFAAALTGCDLYSQDGYVEQYVVEAYMIAGEPLPTVFVSTTAPFTSVYEFERFAVAGADVHIALLDQSGGIESLYDFREQSKGVYEPGDENVLVIPRRSYELRVTMPDGHSVTARTIIPDVFETVRFSSDTLVYQGSHQFEVDISRSYYPGRQNIYAATVTALDPEGHGLTPFYADLDDDEDRVVNESNLFNEANFQVNPDGTVRLPLPWISIAYFGPNRVELYAVDDNFYDFWRTAAIQRGGSTLSPGEIPNVIYHVEGGIGLFAGMARASLEVFVQRNPAF